MRNMKAFAVIAILALSVQHAALAGSSGSRSSGGGGSSRSSSGSIGSGSSRSMTYRPVTSSKSSSGAAATNRSGGNAPGALRGATARQSLLAGAPAASPKLTQIIKEKESSGPGWLGTAFLISVLSQHDLSSSDRSWIESRISALRKDGQDEDNALLPATHPLVAFSYVGLLPTYKVGGHIEITATARGATAKAVPVKCTLDGAQVQQEGNGARIALTTTAAAVQVLSCQAGGRQDRKLIRIAA